MKLSRRFILRGAGGVALGLPLLPSLMPREARGQAAPKRPKYAVFMRQGNGVAQASNGEPERFWPRALGPVTTASLSGTDKDRALSELAEHASKLLIVSGLRFAFREGSCSHAGGGIQLLTAARQTAEPSNNLALALGESIDNRIAREFNAGGREPLTLFAGRRTGYLEDVLSYRGPQQRRAAELNPFNAYTKMVGLADADAATKQRLAAARMSVNDLVREEMKSLLAHPRLSTEDRQRLDLHFSSVRDMETTLACSLEQASVEEMKTLNVDSAFSEDVNIERAARAHAELIALSFACGYSHAATLQVGTGVDSTEYTIEGRRLPRYHHISHRIHSDGSDGEPMPDAVLLHHQIDRLHGRLFKYLLDRLATRGLLDDSIAVWTSEIAHGVTHSFTNVPFIIAGSGGGYLKQGQYVHANGGSGSVTHNLLLNTLLNAVGCKKSDGSPVDDFGDASLPKGELSALKA